MNYVWYIFTTNFISLELTLAGCYKIFLLAKYNIPNMHMSLYLTISSLRKPQYIIEVNGQTSKL